MPSAESPTLTYINGGNTNLISSKLSAMDKSNIDHLHNGVAPTPQQLHPNPKLQHIWLITGPAGCGKSTVAQYIADALSLPYLEGDSFHPQSNITKMSNNQPLTDQDRWDWLITLRTAALTHLLQTPDNPSPPSGVVVTCSALKQRYRDVLRIAGYNHPSVRVHFVYLSASEAVLLDRVAKRENHYMKPEMVHSQFESLELPGPEETDVLSVDVGAPKHEVEQEALRKVRQVVDSERELQSSL